jgi:cytidylate kinase
MSTINRNVPIVQSSKGIDMNEFNHNRLIRNRIRKENHQKDLKFDDMRNERATQSKMIDEQNVEASADNMDHANQEDFLRYVNHGTSLSQKLANVATYSNKNVEKLMAKYKAEISLDELSTFFEDDKLEQDKLDGLANELAGGEDSMAEGILSDFIAKNNLDKAQIYVMLSYLVGVLNSEQKHREKLRKLVASLLKKLEQQESAYLFNFFNLLENKELQKKPKLVKTLAEMAAGDISITTIKQSLRFVEESLEDDYDNLVSKCIKYRVHILKRLNNMDLSFEDKTELIDYFKFEKNIIILQSVYSRLGKLNNYIKEVKKGVVNEYGNSSRVGAVFSFSELSMFSDSALSVLIRNLGFEIDIKKSTGFINELVRFFISLPLEVFNSTSGQKQKVVEGLRQKLQNAGSTATKDGGSFGFIKPARLLIQYI